MEFSKRPKDFNAGKVQHYQKRNDSHISTPTIIFCVRVIKFWCFFRWIKNSKGFNIKRIPKSRRKDQRIETKLPNILAGRKSGGARISDQYYEDLLRIWGGSPCVEALPFSASLAI